MTRGLNGMMAALLRRATALVPADRREWAEAILAEAAVVPAGPARLRWLAGGLRLTVGGAPRRLGYPLAFAAAAAGTAWSAWSGPPGDPGVAINRVDVITMAVILAALPWAVAKACGPVAAGWLARLLRTGGYGAVLALVLVKTAVRRVADAPPNNLGGATAAWLGEAVFLAVMAGYAAVILACTSRRPPAARATVVYGTVTGTAAGVVAYALGPLGFPLRFAGPWPAGLYDAAMALGVLLALCAPVAAALAATRGLAVTRGQAVTPSQAVTRSQVPGSARLRRGAMAGLCSGSAAALVVAVLSTATIALLPYDAGLRDWAAGHIGHWTPAAGHWGPVVGPGTRVGYVAGNSAFAAGYLIVLVLGPLLGCALGACAARAARTVHTARAARAARAARPAHGRRDTA
jgi:hypothetical protein